MHCTDLHCLMLFPICGYNCIYILLSIFLMIVYLFLYCTVLYVYCTDLHNFYRTVYLFSWSYIALHSVHTLIVSLCKEDELKLRVSWRGDLSFSWRGDLLGGTKPVVTSCLSLAYALMLTSTRSAAVIMMMTIVMMMTIAMTLMLTRKSWQQWGHDSNNTYLHRTACCLSYLLACLLFWSFNTFWRWRWLGWWTASFRINLCKTFSLQPILYFFCPPSAFCPTRSFLISLHSCPFSTGN